jgi:hypothetical protein
VRLAADRGKSITVSFRSGKWLDDGKVVRGFTAYLENGISVNGPRAQEIYNLYSVGAPTGCSFALDTTILPDSFNDSSYARSGLSLPQYLAGVIAHELKHSDLLDEFPADEPSSSAENILESNVHNELRRLNGQR